jgi:hypothetical protein
VVTFQNGQSHHDVKRDGDQCDRPSFVAIEQREIHFPKPVLVPITDSLFATDLLEPV